MTGVPHRHGDIAVTMREVYLNRLNRVAGVLNANPAKEISLW